jgi:hypothetical protein
MADFMTTSLLDLPDWQTRFAENKLGTIAPNVPVYLYHGTADQVIPYAVGTALRDDYCARGAVVTWKEYPGVEHITGQIIGFQDAQTWLAARLAGSPPTSSCPPSGSGGSSGSGGAAGNGGAPGGCECSAATDSSSSGGLASLGFAVATCAAALRRRRVVRS